MEHFSVKTLLKLSPLGTLLFFLGYMLALSTKTMVCNSDYCAPISPPIPNCSLPHDGKTPAVATTQQQHDEQSSLQAQLQKWLLYADVQLKPSMKIVLRGDPEKCSADASCQNQQKWYDTIELMSLPPTAKCNIQRPIGKGDTVGQGPYKVCLDRPYRPIAKQCLVYSFGIAYDWSFDDGMAAFGCDVVSFDPSIGLQAHNRSARHKFFPYGIASENGVFLPKAKGKEPNGQWQMRTVNSLHSSLGHGNRIIDILKIDAEGAEMKSLAQLISDDFLASHVRMLLVEWHVPPENSPTEQILASYYQLRYVAGFEAYYTETRFQGIGFYTVEGLINTNQL